MQKERLIKNAATYIEKGGVILCPTDTIYGLSADARNLHAVNKIFEIKQRPANKSMIVLVSSFKMLKTYVHEAPDAAYRLIEESSEPTSIIYPQGVNLAKNVTAQNGSIAIRLVNQGICHELIEYLGYPIVSTSANLSGESNPTNLESINEKIKNEVDFILIDSSSKNKESTASSIFLIEGDKLKKIR